MSKQDGINPLDRTLLTVVAKVVVNKDSIEVVKAQLLKLIAPTRKEAGCIEYRLHQDDDDPAVFIFYETWESLACLEQHMNSPHFKDYISAVDGKIAEKVVHKMTAINQSFPSVLILPCQVLQLVNGPAANDSEECVRALQKTP